ncbi:MAG: hypothetical protein JO287_11445 [Pseudonocardiales bacterium]|nr:hypothetical protein [Pseudonocardiales bacterium]
MTPPPSVTDVERISALTDPVMRNLRITQCYHELSLALAARTGGSANWCTFAVWASKQVGQTIRKEDLERTIERLWATSSEMALVTRSPDSIPYQATDSAQPTQLPQSRRAAGHGILQAVSRGTPLIDLADHQLIDFVDHHQRIHEAVRAASSLDQASEVCARGNLKVFKEIAREFARFLEDVADATAFDADKLAQFCAGLHLGDPPHGQRYLIQAFTSYHRALFEHDTKTREEHLLLGNVAVGLHEQTRLQPEIYKALNAAIIDPTKLRKRLLKIFLPDLKWLDCLRWHLWSRIGLHDPVESAISRLVEQARLLARVAITEHIMTLDLPGGVQLKLGQDLHGDFPPVLEVLVDAELVALLKHIHAALNSLTGTAVADWSVLPRRMHFIADFFRLFQDRQDLLSPPFSPSQVAELTQGRRPEGPL